MQTIYIDISSKSVVPTIYTKQGDVGRKFEVVFTNSGLPYVPPNGSVFSVWYSGSSGEGNYTDIGDRSAFSVNENRVTVEMIAQMLTNDGTGILCLVLNEPNGNQIGSWNIPYLCEKVPGSKSEGAKEYYTAFSESVEKLKQVTENLTPEAIGAAPAGYGLGESDHNIPANGSITIRFNSQRHIALIAVQGSHMNNRSVFVVNTYGNGGVRTHIKRLCGEDTILYGILPESADNTNGIVLFNQSTDGYVSASILILFGAYPEVTNGNSGVTAEPFEWDNPPMIPGVEYRTTKRFRGLPVYAQLVQIDALPNAKLEIYPFSPSNLKDKVSFSFSFYQKDNNTTQGIAPTKGLTFDANEVHAQWSGESVTSGIRIITSYDASNNVGLAFCEYTKST